MYTIRNEYLEVEVSPQGAELQRITDLYSGREYLWDGDPTFWKGRSPILFPNVGCLWNGECRINGRVCHLPKHGFVRYRPWQIVRQGGEQICLSIENAAAELNDFPWPYRLTVTYTLDGRSLRADFRVINHSPHSTMWFQLGGHPALRLPDGPPRGHHCGGFLRFEGSPRNLLRSSVQGCTEEQRVSIPWSKNLQTITALAFHQLANALVPITAATFEHDALIFDGAQITAIQLLDRRRRRIARVSSSAPTWLAWAPVGKEAPFVCLEPWYGLPDPQGFCGEISERPAMQHLAPGNEWNGWFAIEV